MGRVCCCIFMRMVPGRTVWLFTNKTEVILEAAPSFNRGEVQGIDIHGIWISGWVSILGTSGVIRS